MFTCLQIRIVSIVMAALAASKGPAATACASIGPALSERISIVGSERLSFTNDIEPILTRAGCNQGSCHGSQFGKGGFKLSLAAYDPQFDHDSIVRSARGRRISPI